MSELRRREPVIGGGSPDASDTATSEIDDALADLDRMTGRFAGGVADLSAEIDEIVAVRGRAEPADRPEPRRGPDPAQRADPEELESRMSAAEAEARRYLERAKGRADKLVQTMLSAVERESERIRSEAQARIEARWATAQAEAERHVSEAERVAEGMVAERQQRISELSDRITASADQLTGGMEEAVAVKAQFEGFIAELSRTASRIAEDAPAASTRAALRRLDERHRGDGENEAVAA